MRKKWLSRAMASMLAGVMVVGLMCGCGQEENKESSAESTVQNQVESSDVAEESSEEVKEPEEITYPLEGDEALSIFVTYGIGLPAGAVSAEDSPFHTGLSEHVGVDIDWQFPAAGTDPQVALSLVWQEKELPDIITGGLVTIDQATIYLKDEVIWDLTDYLPIYAPDYWEFINRPENAEDLMTLVTEDGRHIGIWSFRESSYNTTWCGPIIRQDWLDECGLEAPRTVEEFENVLVVFNEKYGAKLAFPYQNYGGTFGIASGLGAYCAFGPNYYLDDNNQVQFGHSQPEAKEMLGVLNKWYDMGLLDPDFATSDVTTTRAKAIAGEVGVTFGAMSLVTNMGLDAEKENTGAEWVGFPYLVEEIGKPAKYGNAARGLVTAYGTVITKGATEEELITALKLLNYGFTEEGMLYHNFGTEGISYTVDASGNIQWTDLVKNDPDGLDTAIRRYSGAHTGCMASVQLEAFVKAKNSEAAGAAVYKWIENNEAPKHYMPSVSLTAEEEEIHNKYYDAIGTFVEQSSLKFITGEDSLDNYDKFLATLEEMGLQECLRVRQAAVDRYFGK